MLPHAGCTHPVFAGQAMEDAAESAMMQVPGFGASSDLLVLPSETESFGLVALEAFAAGVPVISTNVGGLPEVNLQRKTGMLRPVGDVRGMAEDALHVLDSANRKRFREAALERAEAFHIHKILPQYESLYRRALASHTS